MIDFLEIAFMLLAVLVFGSCLYWQGKRDAHSQARFDVLESIMCDQDKLNGEQLTWNQTMRATVNAMAVQECQRRMFTAGDVEFLYQQMRLRSSYDMEPERIARGEGN